MAPVWRNEWPSSSFSPTRSPIKIPLYTSSPEAKPVPKAIAFVPASVAQKLDLPAAGFYLPEELVSIMQQRAWLTDPLSPRIASVCKTWHRASVLTEQELRYTHVAPLRPYPKDGLKPSLAPTITAETMAIINGWGAHLDRYQVINFGLGEWEHVPISIDASDMARLLGGESWLNNFTVDPFLSTCMPMLSAKLPVLEAGYDRVFIPSWYSRFFSSAEPSFPEFTDDRVRQIIARHLRTTKEVYMVYNLTDIHWFAMRIQREWKRVEIFDSLDFALEQHARDLLKAMGDFLEVRNAALFTHIMRTQCCSVCFAGRHV